MHDLPALLEHRLLIFARRNGGCVKRSNIRRLTYRICEEATGILASKPRCLISALTVGFLRRRETVTRFI